MKFPLRKICLAVMAGVFLVAVYNTTTHRTSPSAEWGEFPRVRNGAGTSVTENSAEHVASTREIDLGSESCSVDVCHTTYNSTDVSHATSNSIHVTPTSNSIHVTPPTSNSIPTLYIITPTYRRPEQIPELTRLSQTLMHVPNIHWLVIEDSPYKTQQVHKFLIRSNLSYTHLIAPMPLKYRRSREEKPKGVSNRNRGLAWLRSNAVSGVFYFADDDNTYDLDLFREMRSTKRVSMWPVGLVAGYGVNSPIVRGGVIIGFYAGWRGRRKFPVDMAGFAVSVEFLLQRPWASMPYESCFEEEGFLRSLSPLELKDIEPKADNCTRILVWHTQTYRNRPARKISSRRYRSTNLVQLMKQIV